MPKKKASKRTAAKPAPKKTASKTAGKAAAKKAAKPVPKKTASRTAKKPTKKPKTTTSSKPASPKKTSKKVAAKTVKTKTRAAARKKSSPAKKRKASTAKASASKAQHKKKIALPPGLKKKLIVKKRSRKKLKKLAPKAPPKPAKRANIFFSQEIQMEEEVVLTDADGRRYCRVPDCDRSAEVGEYCRFHYLSLWDRIQTKKQIIEGGHLDQYIEKLTLNYPLKSMVSLLKDLRSTKEFNSLVHDMGIVRASDERSESMGREDE